MCHNKTATNKLTLRDNPKWNRHNRRHNCWITFRRMCCKQAKGRISLECGLWVEKRFIVITSTQFHSGAKQVDITLLFCGRFIQTTDIWLFEPDTQPADVMYGSLLKKMFCLIRSQFKTKWRHPPCLLVLVRGIWVSSTILDLLWFHGNGRRHRPQFNWARIRYIHNPQLNFWIRSAGRRITNATHLWKWYTHSMDANIHARIKPWIGHCTHARIIERCKHNMSTVVRAPNGFRCCKYFLCK